MKSLALSILSVVLSAFFNVRADGSFKVIYASGAAGDTHTTLEAAFAQVDNDGTVELQSDGTWSSTLTLTDKHVTITSLSGNKFVLKRASADAGFVVDAESSAKHTPDSDYSATAEDKDGFNGNSGIYCYETARLTFKNVIIDGGAVWTSASSPSDDSVETGSVTGGQLVLLKAGLVTGTWNRANTSGLKIEDAEIRNFKTDGKYMIASGGKCTSFRMNPGSKIVNCRGTHGVYTGYNDNYVFLRLLGSEITGCKVSNTSAAIIYNMSRGDGWNIFRLRDVVITNNVAAHNTYGALYTTKTLPVQGKVVVKDNFLADGTTPANVRLASGVNVDLYDKLAAESYIGLKRASQTPATDVVFGTATYIEEDANAAAFVYDGNPVSGVNYIGRVSGSSVVWKDATVPDPGDEGDVFRLKNPGDATGVMYANLAKAFAAAQNDAVIEVTDGTAKYHNTIIVTNRVTLTSAPGHTYTLTRNDLAKFLVKYVDKNHYGNLNITNLTIDGGTVWTNPNTIESATSTGIAACDFAIIGSSSSTYYATLSLGAGATLKNFKTASYLIWTDSTDTFGQLKMEAGSLITDCRGAGCIFRNGNNPAKAWFNGGTITRCSTSASIKGLVYLAGNSSAYYVSGVAITNNYFSNSATYAFWFGDNTGNALYFAGGKTIIRDNYYVKAATKTSAAVTNQHNVAYGGATYMAKAHLTGAMDKDADVRIDYPTSGAVDGAAFLPATYVEDDANPRAFRYDQNPVAGTNYVGKISGAYVVWVDELKKEVKHDQYDSFRVSNDGGSTWTVKKSLLESFGMAEANAIIEVIDDHGELWKPIEVPVNGITLRSKPGERHVLTRTEAAGITTSVSGRRLLVTNLVIDAGAVWANGDLGDPTEDGEQGGKAGNAASLFVVGQNDNQSMTHGFDLLDVEIRNFNGTGGSAVIDVYRGAVKLDAGTFIHDCRCGTNSLAMGSIIRTGKGLYNTRVDFNRCAIYSNSCGRVHYSVSDRGIEYYGDAVIASNLVYDCALRPSAYWDTTTYGCHFTGGKTFIWDNFNRKGSRADFYPLSETGNKEVQTVVMLDGEFAAGAKVGVCYPATDPDGVNFAYNNVVSEENPAAAFVYDGNPVGEGAAVTNYVGFASGENILWRDETKTRGLDQKDAFRYRNVGDAGWTVCNYLQQAFRAVTDGAVIEVIKADAKFDKSISLTNGTVTLRSMPGLDATLTRVEAASISVDSAAAACGLVISNLTLSGGANWSDPNDLYSLAQGAEAVGPAAFFVIGLAGSELDFRASLTLGEGSELRDVYAQVAAIRCLACSDVTLTGGVLLTGIRGARVVYLDDNNSVFRCAGCTVVRCASPSSGFGFRNLYSDIYLAGMTVTNNLARGYPFVDVYGEDRADMSPTLHLGGGKLIIRDNILHPTTGTAATTGNLRLGTATDRVLFEGEVDEESDVHVYANVGAVFGSTIGTLKTISKNVHPELFVADNLAGAHGKVVSGKVVWSSDSTPAVAGATDSQGNMTYYPTLSAAADGVADYGTFSFLAPSDEKLSLSGRNVTLLVGDTGFAGDIAVGPFATVKVDGRASGPMTGSVTVDGRSAVFEANGATLGEVLVKKGSARLNDVAVTKVTATGGELYVAYSEVDTFAASGSSAVTLGFGNTITTRDIEPSVVLDDYLWVENTATDAVRMTVDGGAATAYATFDAAVAAIPATASAVIIELLRNATMSADADSNKFQHDFALTVRSAPEAKQRFVLRRAANVRLRLRPADKSYAHAFRFENIVLDGGAVWRNALYADLSQADKMANDGVATGVAIVRLESSTFATFANGTLIRNAASETAESPIFAAGNLTIESGSRITDCRSSQRAVIDDNYGYMKLTMTGGRIDHNVGVSVVNCASLSASATNIVITGGEIVRNVTSDAVLYLFRMPYVIADAKVIDNVTSGYCAVYERNVAGSCGYFHGDAVVRGNRKPDGSKAGLYLQARPAVIDGELGSGAYLEVHGQGESVKEGGAIASGEEGGVTYTSGAAGFDRIVYNFNPKNGVWYAAKSDGAGNVVWSAASLVVGAGETKSVSGNLTAGLLKFELDGTMRSGTCNVSGNVTFANDAIISVGADADATKAMRGGMKRQTLLTASSITPPSGGLAAICRMPKGFFTRIVTNDDGTQSLIVGINFTGMKFLFR